MKIRNLSKFIRSVVIILGVIILLSLITNKTFSHAEKDYKSICIDNGDTLWSIAKMEQDTNSYYKDKDIRYIINDIMEENDLENKNIYANQTLKIPTM